MSFSIFKYFKLNVHLIALFACSNELNFFPTLSPDFSRWEDILTDWINSHLLNPLLLLALMHCYLMKHILFLMLHVTVSNLRWVNLSRCVWVSPLLFCFHMLICQIAFVVSVSHIQILFFFFFSNARRMIMLALTCKSKVTKFILLKSYLGVPHRV